MVLDTGDDEIFIWIGKGASPQEKKDSNKMADVCKQSFFAIISIKKRWVLLFNW